MPGKRVEGGILEWLSRSGTWGHWRRSTRSGCQAERSGPYQRSSGARAKEKEGTARLPTGPGVTHCSRLQLQVQAAIGSDFEFGTRLHLRHRVHHCSQLTCADTHHTWWRARAHRFKKKDGLAGTSLELLEPDASKPRFAAASKSPKTAFVAPKSSINRRAF